MMEYAHPNVNSIAHSTPSDSKDADARMGKIIILAH